MILADGIARLCEDLGVEPSDIVLVRTCGVRARTTHGGGAVAAWPLLLLLLQAPHLVVEAPQPVEAKRDHRSNCPPFLLLLQPFTLSKPTNFWPSACPRDL
jgi:hypothetical protein